ncbi:MAG: THUMP domain-containing class I SAM-dependent RNA methyltransferase [Thermoanaerobaculum sp.]
MAFSCVATCSRGLEVALAAELSNLGLASEPGRGAVHFHASFADLVRANLWLRTAMRVLVFLREGPCASRGELYALAKAFPWEDYLARNATVAVQVAGRNPAFANTHFATLVVKDGLVDRLRERRGWRPSVDLQNPSLRVVLHLQPERASLYLDSSGEPLSHRGYRQKDALAPLSECLAAGMLLLAGYDGTQALCDPMCGSGTILVEAALMAFRRPPGWQRRFAFESWPFADPAALASVREESLARQGQPPAPICGRDISPEALASARRALRTAGVERWVRVEQGDVRELPPMPAGSLIVSNPPYGLRVGEERELAELYRGIGDAVKKNAAGSTLWLLLGNRRLARQLGLRPAQRFELYNGPVRCEFCAYPVVAGTFAAKTTGSC